MSIDLPLIWAGIVAFAVLAYILLDGFDLGVGILFPLLREGNERDTAMNSIAPVWDGNETWLVLGGGGLYAAFPLAYATILPALYIPITAMLLGLVFRGVAFEFRWRDASHRPWWDRSFAAGSMIAAAAQGVVLGALVQGVPDHIDNLWWWLSPFSLLTGVALVIGYVLLGATWLVMKSEGTLEKRARRLARPAGIATVFFIGAVSALTPLLDPVYLARWFAWPSVLLSVAMPLAVLACTATLFNGLRDGHRMAPFAASLGLFTLSFIGILISFFPYLVPPSISLWDAAAPDDSLAFLLVGTAVLLPIIGAYTAYSYWVFRGVTGSSGGHH
ncbi:MAG: cytochrome d ubiquinol oxidase subunit II [Gammaproteobacteria bacterium]|nr:cytochrome d ubiquinol oxidase subunit II [Gammaproteobacteria bacterium]